VLSNAVLVSLSRNAASARNDSIKRVAMAAW
jgi:hypothetical protein